MSFIDFDGCRVFYSKRGTGKAILFGHSYLWDSNMWNAVVDELSQDYCCICVDLPGHGQSGALKGVSLQKLSDLHKAVMLQEGFQKFSLAGLSIGGMWGAILACDSEVDVDKFIILNSSLTSEPLETKEKYLAMLSVIEQLKRIPDPIVDQIAPGFFSSDRVAEFVDGFIVQLKGIPEEKISTLVEVGRSFVERNNILSDFQFFKGDLQVIAGENDKYRSLEESREIAKQMNSELKQLPAGHISTVEVPRLISKALKSFINK